MSTQGSAAGPASRYTELTGDTYWQYQQPMGELGGRLNRQKFAPYIGDEDVIVDFGCGGAYLLEGLPGRIKVGVEVNPAARTAAVARGLDVRERLADLDDNFADVLISNHALEHTLEPYVILQEMMRVLKPGGRLIIWLPVDDFRRRQAAGADPDGHLYTWTPQLMANLLREIGFHDAKCAVVTNAWPPGVRHLADHQRLLDATSWLWSALRRRRQLRVHALAPSPA